jgi:phosphoheptose isomerase/putative methionine-R-sulfoxide reductase with GAF domain
MTKYWIGPVVGLHLFATIGVLIFATAPVRDAYHDYLIHIMPLVVCDVLIRYIALQTWQHPSTPKTTLTNAVALVYATWPIYLWAWLMAVFRLPLSFKPTPKSKSRLNPAWLLPQIIALVLLVTGTLYTIFVSGHKPSIMLVFAILQGGIQLILLVQWLATEAQIDGGVPRYLAAMKNHSQSTELVRQEVNGIVRTYITDLPFAMDPIPLDLVEKSINTLNQARLRNKQVFIMGENGSQPLASLFASDLARDHGQVGWTIYLLDWLPEESERAKDAAEHMLYQHIFIRQFKSLIQSEDVLIVLSADGDRPKTLHALQLARRAGAHSLALTGVERGHLGLQAEINLHVPCDTEEQFEDGVLILEHIIFRALREVRESAQKDRSHGKRSQPDPQALITPGASRDKAVLEAHLPTRAKTVFEALYALSQENKQANSRDHLLKRVLEVTSQVLEADSGSLVLFDEQGNAREAVMAYEGEVHIYPVEHLVDILQRGLAGWVIQHRQPVLVGDTRNDTRWLRRAWEEKQVSRSAISAPLIDGEDVFGVLTLVHAEAGRFREDDLILLGAIAVNAAMLGVKTLRESRKSKNDLIPQVINDEWTSQ